jgi:hypothetical protein
VVDFGEGVKWEVGNSVELDRRAGFFLVVLVLLVVSWRWVCWWITVLVGYCTHFVSTEVSGLEVGGVDSTWD